MPKPKTDPVLDSLIPEALTKKQLRRKFYTNRGEVSLKDMTLPELQLLFIQHYETQEKCDKLVQRALELLRDALP